MLQPLRRPFVTCCVESGYFRVYAFRPDSDAPTISILSIGLAMRIVPRLCDRLGIADRSGLFQGAICGLR